jgi:hypothetical protein
MNNSTPSIRPALKNS